MLEAQHALELLQAHHGRRAGHEPHDRSVRQKIHDETQPEDAEGGLEDAGEESGSEGKMKVERRVLRGRHLRSQHGPNKQRRHGHRPHRQVPRAPHHGVHQRRHEARIEAKDGGQVGELGVADALRDGEAGDGDAGDEVRLEGAEPVGRDPFQEREEVAERGHGAPAEAALPDHGPERVVGEEGLLEVRPERVQERPRLRHRHPRRRPHRLPGAAAVDVLLLVLLRAAAHGRRLRV